jgi:hypothetical protein
MVRTTRNSAFPLIMHMRSPTCFAVFGTMCSHSTFVLPRMTSKEPCSGAYSTTLPLSARDLSLNGRAAPSVIEAMFGSGSPKSSSECHEM